GGDPGPGPSCRQSLPGLHDDGGQSARTRACVVWRHDLEHWHGGTRSAVLPPACKRGPAVGKVAVDVSPFRYDERRVLFTGDESGSQTAGHDVAVERHHGPATTGNGS